MNCFAFDIETIPDVEFGRRMWNLEDLSDEDVATAMSFMQQQKTGSDFLPLHQHKVVAISVALRTGDSFKIWSLGDAGSDEADLVRRFYDGIDRYSPDLVSWNGSGFDLPVLHYTIIPPLAAVACAVGNAVGHHMTRLPLSPPNILTAIQSDLGSE